MALRPGKFVPSSDAKPQTGPKVRTETTKGDTETRLVK